MIKLILYSASVVPTGAGTDIPGSFATLVWEPYFNTPYGGSVADFLDTWNSESIDASRGTDTAVAAGGSTQGWWTTSSSWGNSAVKINGGGVQRNLKQWAAYYSSLSASLDDAVIVEVQIGIGTYNPGLITYVNNAELVASPSLDDTCTFAVAP